jgi:hypothetical protein
MAQATASWAPVAKAHGEPAPAPANALIRRLQAMSGLTLAERAALWELVHAWEWVPAGAVIEKEGDSSGAVHGVLAGLACRHKDFRDGRRQIIAILFPGDLSRDVADGARPTDHHVRALSPTIQASAARCTGPRLSRAPCFAPGSSIWASDRPMSVWRTCSAKWPIAWPTTTFRAPTAASNCP